MQNEPEYYTVSEIAAKAKVSRQAIDKRLIKAKLKTIKFGRTRVIKAEDLHYLLS